VGGATGEGVMGASVGEGVIGASVGEGVVGATGPVGNSTSMHEWKRSFVCWFRPHSA